MRFILLSIIILLVSSCSLLTSQNTSQPGRMSSYCKDLRKEINKGREINIETPNEKDDEDENEDKFFNTYKAPTHFETQVNTDKGQLNYSRHCMPQVDNDTTKTD